MLQKIPIIHLEGVFCELALFLEISTSPDRVGTKIEPKKNCHLDAFAFQGISNVTDIRGANNPENLTRAHPAKVNNRSGYHNQHIPSLITKKLGSCPIILKELVE